MALKYVPMVIVCGAVKLGKTTEAFKTFQNSLAILSSVDNPHYFRKMLRTKLKDPIIRIVGGVEREFVYKPPKRIKLIDVYTTNVPTKSEPYTFDIMPITTFGKYVDGVLTPSPDGDVAIQVNQIDALEGTIKAVFTKSLAAINRGEPPPYDALIIDEWGEFMDRAYSEILPTAETKKGEIDGRKAFGLTLEWVTKVMNWMKQLTACGVSVCLVTHDRDPDTTDKGQLRKGGPKAPSAGIGNKIVGMSSGAIQRYMKDPPYMAKNPDGSLMKPKRLWRATATEQWGVGLRGIEPEDEDEIADKELYDVLTQYAGYEL